jgi:hypothetical protein
MGCGCASDVIEDTKPNLKLVSNSQDDKVNNGQNQQQESNAFFQVKRHCVGKYYNLFRGLSFFFLFLDGFPSFFHKFGKLLLLQLHKVSLPIGVCARPRS